MPSSFDPQNDAEFDAHAGRYREMHAAVLTASGEDPEYFAKYKLRVLLEVIRDDRRPVLDFGCGIGNLTHLLASARADVHGYDPSSRSVSLARDQAPSATFYDVLEEVPVGCFGSIVLANVLHHVDPGERPSLIAGLVPLLAPGGRVVVFEHNRWNPLTVHAVHRCEFDAGVSLLDRPAITSLLVGAGLERSGRRFIVFFPKALGRLRPLEPRLRALPMGAQVCVWAHRPD